MIEQTPRIRASLLLWFPTANWSWTNDGKDKDAVGSRNANSPFEAATPWRGSKEKKKRKKKKLRNNELKIGAKTVWLQVSTSCPFTPACSKPPAVCQVRIHRVDQRVPFPGSSLRCSHRRGRQARQSCPRCTPYSRSTSAYPFRRTWPRWARSSRSGSTQPRPSTTTTWTGTR